MKENSNIENQPEHFRDLMKRHSDDELVKILKKRKHYQPEAARQAILEAINRGIINSEQDLFSEKFAGVSHQSELFPKIDNPVTREKLRRSISRSFIIAGAIPLVWCILKWNSNSQTESLLVLVYSLVWIGVAFRLFQTKDVRFGYGLLILLVPGLFYFVRLMIRNPFPPVYEILVPVVLVVFILYGVVYLHKLKE